MGSNMRLFKAAGGDEPPDHQRRIAMIRMLPVEIGAYNSMHWEEPQYSSFVELKKFIFKYIKTLQNLKRVTNVRAAHLLD